MATTLTLGKVNLQLDLILQNTVGVAAVQANLSRGLLKALTSGVGADQVDKVYSETKSLAGNYDLDLSGVLLDAYGAICSFARVKLLAVFADAANTGNVVVGGAAATQWVGPFGAAAHTVAVRPGGALLFFAPDATGWPVVGGASDFLRFAPSAGTQLCDIVIAGASA